jgi:hypothetical protein
MCGTCICGIVTSPLGRLKIRDVGMPRQRLNLIGGDCHAEQPPSRGGGPKQVQTGKPNLCGCETPLEVYMEYILNIAGSCWYLKRALQKLV